MKPLIEALKNAADGAFVVNKEQHIVYWNQAAQDMLGHVPTEVANRPCHEVLAGCDDQGRLICQDHCRVAGTALGGATVANYDIRVRTKTSGQRWVNMSTLTFPTNDDGNGFVLVHLFRDVTQKKQHELFIDQVLGAASTLRLKRSSLAVSTLPEESLGGALTDRESEVLSLLAEGLSTSDIARSLSISPSTVRNHIRNILQKFQVHNRLEAVVYALKHGLVTRE